MPRITLLLLAAALAVPAWLFPSLAAGQEDRDRLVLASGLTLRGELLSARRGEVTFDTDEMDEVTVDIEDVALLESPAFFEVVLEDASIYQGSLTPAGQGSVTVVGDAVSTTIAILDIVSIRSFDEGFWSRTNGYADVGATVAQANALRSLRVGGDFNFQGPLWGFSVSGETYQQSQDATDADGETFEQTTDRASLQTALRRNLGSRWSIQATGDWERNEELDLESRFQFGLGGNYDFVASQEMELRAGAGLVNNTEDYVGEEQSTSAEIVAGGSLDIFDLGDIDLYTSLLTYTNLNESGRLRVVFNGRISWEIIDDFDIGFTVLERFDNRPPSASSQKRDFQYGFSLGWSWG